LLPKPLLLMKNACAKIEQRARHDAEAEDRRRIQPEGEASPGMSRMARHFANGRVKVHKLDDAQVVERADDGGSCGDDDKHAVLRDPQLLDDAQLGPESDEGRNSGR